MIVKVKYLNEDLNSYVGRDYTYRTNLPLEVFDKVLCPTYKGITKGLVVITDCPESEIDPEWADRVQTITEYDDEDEEDEE